MNGHLLRSDEPQVFHSTAGKHRTAVAAALILEALGEPRATVMRDYLLTNEFYRMPAARDSRLSPEVLQVLWRVQAGFLEAAYQAVDEDFGGMDAYLAGQLDVGPQAREHLRRVYLQATPG